MVIIEMENGKNIELELYPEIAPISCENFEKLVKDGFVTIDDVKVKIGDAATQSYTDIDATGEYARIVIIDEYNRGDAPFGYNIPGADATISITFTVTGLTD